MSNINAINFCIACKSQHGKKVKGIISNTNPPLDFQVHPFCSLFFKEMKTISSKSSVQGKIMIEVDNIQNLIFNGQCSKCFATQTKDIFCSMICVKCAERLIFYKIAIVKHFFI